MNWIMECIRFSDLITIFDIRNEENLDKKILAALLKGDDLSLQAQVEARAAKPSILRCTLQWCGTVWT